MQSNNSSSALAKIILSLTAIGIAGYIILTIIGLILAVMIFVVAIAFIIFVFSMMFSGSVTIGSFGVLILGLL